MTHATDSAKAGAPLPTSQMRELLGETTPGPYGFQAYGRRERLVTMAVGEGNGQPFAIFTRAEDARGFAAAVASMPAYLDRIEALEKALERISDHADDKHVSGRVLLDECGRIAKSLLSPPPVHGEGDRG